MEELADLTQLTFTEYVDRVQQASDNKNGEELIRLGMINNLVFYSSLDAWRVHEGMNEKYVLGKIDYRSISYKIVSKDNIFETLVFSGWHSHKYNEPSDIEICSSVRFMNSGNDISNEDIAKRIVEPFLLVANEAIGPKINTEENTFLVARNVLLYFPGVDTFLDNFYHSFENGKFTQQKLKLF